MDSVIKILIAEDTPAFASSLKELLKKEKDFQIVGCVFEEKDTLKIVREKSPDLVLVDVHSEQSLSDKIQLSRRLRIETDVRTLILVEDCTPEQIRNVFREGFASGCFFRSQLSLLTFYIRALVQGHTAQEYMIELSLLDCLSEAEKSVFWNLMGWKVKLSSSQKTILNQRREIVKKFGLKNQKELKHIFQLFLEEDGPAPVG